MLKFDIGNLLVEEFLFYFISVMFDKVYIIQGFFIIW